MIPVSLNVLIFIYLALMLGLIFGAWIISTWSRRRRKHQAFRYLIRCSLCAFEFEDGSETPLAVCPRCAALNERRRASQL
jgi:rRNA maturation endonuclease Nob1